jgi:hypothetical protein
MSRLAVKAELDKLGGTLDLEPETLAFMGDVPAEQLRALRVAVYELLFTQDRVVYRRLARIAARLPARLSAWLSERVLGPAVTARVAAELTSARTLGAAMHTSPTFLADVCMHLDPRRTRDFIRQLPADRVVDAARELVGRGDFMTMSRFVDFFSDETIRAVEEAIEDEGALLRVAFYMGSKNRVDHLFGLLPRERLEKLILRVEEQSEELLPAFLALLIHVSYTLKRELGDLAAAQGDAVLSGYIRAAHGQGLWPDMLPVVTAMSEPARHKVVNLPILSEPAVQESILHAADEHGLWGIVLAFVQLMEDDANREAVAGILAGMPRETLERAADAALMGERWEALLDLVRRMPEAKQDEFARIVWTLGDVDQDLLRRIAQRAEAHGLGERFLNGRPESDRSPHLG